MLQLTVQLSFLEKKNFLLQSASISNICYHSSFILSLPSAIVVLIRHFRFLLFSSIYGTLHPFSSVPLYPSYSTLPPFLLSILFYIREETLPVPLFSISSLPPVNPSILTFIHFIT